MTFDLLAHIGNLSVRLNDGISGKAKRLSNYRVKRYQNLMESEDINSYVIMEFSIVLYFKNDRFQFEKYLIDDAIAMTPPYSKNYHVLQKIKSFL